MIFLFSYDLYVERYEFSKVRLHVEGTCISSQELNSQKTGLHFPIACLAGARKGKAGRRDIGPGGGGEYFLIRG